MAEHAVLNVSGGEPEQVVLVSEPLTQPVAENVTSVVALPMNKRRRLMFVYTDPDQTPKVFLWAIENIFNPGRDHVVLIDAFVSDPTNPVLTAKKLWDLTAGEDDGVELEIKEKKEKELVEFHIENLRGQLFRHQISSQKYILSVNDPRAKLLEVAEATKAEIVVVGHSTPSFVQRALFGSLDDYLTRNCPCSVFVVKPNN